MEFLILMLVLTHLLLFRFFGLVNFTYVICSVFVFQILPLLDRKLVKELLLILELSILVNTDSCIGRGSGYHLH